MADEQDTGGTPADRVTAALLVIGDEILSGRTKDKNIGYIAEHLTKIGIELREVRIVPDAETAIIESVVTLRCLHTYLFTTGGIGPTHDDITAESIAKALGVEIGIDPRALAILTGHYGKRGLELTAPRLRMARIPVGAQLVENSISAAPGFMIANVIVMAGVPSIMQVMLDAVTPRLKTGRPMRSLSIDLSVPEGEIAELLADHQKTFPDVAMGSYPTLRAGYPATQLVLRSTDEARCNDAAEGLEAKLRARRLL
ncbi:MAG: competence/damage-inducible protein A [Hyphomicrobium sp.]|nr:MAG: competence/damage-inducible protein A [Hyphomicrobium sp.]